MKKILLIIVFLMLCGCTSNYKLEISNNRFSEHIEIFTDSMPDSANKYDEFGAEIDNPLIAIIEDDVYSTTTKKYKKRVKNNDNGVNITLDYKYDEATFAFANSLNNCFKTVEFHNDNTYYIHLSEDFKCLYSDSLDIEIVTKNKVLSNNAHEVLGNSYIWHISETNIDSIDIEIELEKGISTNNLILYWSIGISTLLLMVAVFIFYSKRVKNNSI